jgi:predicted RNase H-like HicB family nuclease
MRYPVVLVPDPEAGGYVAYAPVPGCVTQGETVEEALSMAADAVAARLAIATERGEDPDVEAPGAIVASVEVEVLAPTLAAASA